MVTLDLPQRIDPINTSKGVDVNKTKVTPPSPMFQPRPFENHFGLRSDAREIMSYNNYGNFTPTVMSASSMHSQMVDMKNNNTIINLVNNRRKENF